MSTSRPAFPSGPLVQIGQIVGTRGLKGQLKVNPLTDLEAHFQPGAAVYVEGVLYVVQSCAWFKDRPLLNLEGVRRVEEAEKFKWKFLEAEPFEGEGEEDEFRVDDLIGCEVVTEQREVLGNLDEVLLMPAHDVYRVGDIMIPAVREFVKRVDLDRRRITVKLIPGMRGEET